MSKARARDESLYQEIRDFLYWEAHLLDHWRLNEWFESVLTDDIHYEMPVRATTMGKDEFHGPKYIDDNRYRIGKRIERLEHEYAWAERPRSRLRHFISNIILQEIENDEFDVISNFLVMRNRGTDVKSDMLFGERQDTLRRVDGDLRLAERLVLLDQSTIEADDISFFI